MEELIVYEEDRLVLTENIAEQLSKIFKAKKDLEAKEKEIKEALLKEMQASDIISVEHEGYGISIKLVDSYDRETFDSKKFKNDHPDEYDKYVKFTTVKPSVRVSVK